MRGPFLLAETPRGGPFGHRFLIPPATNLRSTEVEAYFQRAALGQGDNFIAVNRQVPQHLPSGSVREGAETILLAGVAGKDLSKEQVQEIRQALNGLLADLEKLVMIGINWEEAGQQTLVSRDELADWLRRDLAGILPSQTWGLGPESKRTAIFIGGLLGLAAGAATLFFWFS